MPELSIIVRTKNEERWISHCLSMLYSQDFTDFEVILVDNQSDDHTLEFASRFPIAQTVEIENFLPGLALNEGIRASSGKYLVCLSAHCIPKSNDWLSSLRSNFDGNDEIAGVYGRQLPVSFTDGVDKRDLLIVFGQDRRIQVKDYFFHNANSMISREVWERFPFDEKVTNIEDRVWGKEVIQAGYRLAYDPDAAVYHYHGLHQGNTPKRVQGIVSILESVDKQNLGHLPSPMLPENILVTAILPIASEIPSGSQAEALLQKTIEDLKRAKFVNSIQLVANDSSLAEKYDIKWIDRSGIPDADFLGLNELMGHALEKIESKGEYPDRILYVNADYLERPPELFDELVRDCQYKGCDCTFPGLVDYGHYWYKSETGAFIQTEPTLLSREHREPQYKGLYGLGCVSSPWLIKSGKLIGGKIGILEISDKKYSLRDRAKTNE